MTFYAASCFLFFAVGRHLGFKDGYKYMKKCVEADLRIYPTKWINYIKKVTENDK